MVYRRRDEVPLMVRLHNKGVAALLGVGYMLMYSLESRTRPATTLLQYQVDASLAANGAPRTSGTPALVGLLAPARAHS